MSTIHNFIFSNRGWVKLSCRQWQAMPFARVSIGHSHAFYVVSVPLEYIPSIPSYSTYVIAFLHIHRLTFALGHSSFDIICILNTNTSVKHCNRICILTTNHPLMVDNINAIIPLSP